MEKNTIDLNQFITSELNEHQRAAVLQKKGALLVLAGAGSGKTRVITTRITNLIVNEHEPAQSIIALTFTNKAAREMQERIKSFLPEETTLPFVGTFHSYCLNTLKRYAALTEMPVFSILDADDQKKILTDIIKRSGLTRTSASQLAYQVSLIKNSVALGAPQSTYLSLFDNVAYEVFLKYEAERKASKCYDFDDLLLETVKLFKTSHEFKETFHNRINHLLIDEYQDTSAVQHELIRQMAKLSNNRLAVASICAVGDDDQSIYSWRGATVSNMLNFHTDFPGTTTIRVEQNYRSTQGILDIANKVITHNQNRNQKKLWTKTTSTIQPLVLTCMSGYQEASLAVRAIDMIARTYTKESIAVLYRTHFQSRVIEEALLQASIPYSIIGGIQFYERKEVKDLLAYLRLLNNPFDRVSFFRVLNTPSRGLGPKCEEQFRATWETEPLLDCFGVAKKLITESTGKKQAALSSFVTTLTSLNTKEKPSELLRTLVSATDYYTYLADEHDPKEAEAKIDNVKELIRAAQHAEQNGLTTLSLFLDDIALMQEKLSAQDHKDHHVQLMTLHAAKGLEFDTVIIAGLEEGLLPSARSVQDNDAVEEERRLLYVGITRAKKRLIITHAKYRHAYGQMTYQLPSRFLEEIPGNLIKAEDASQWSEALASTFFARHFGGKLGNSLSSAPVMTFGAARKSTTSSWRKNQPVKHKQFGVGVIQAIEVKSDKTIITTQFKTGIKKIDAKFLEHV